MLSTVRVQMILVNFSPEISFVNRVKIGIYLDSTVVTLDRCWHV